MLDRQWLLDLCDCATARSHIEMICSDQLRLLESNSVFNDRQLLVLQLDGLTLHLERESAVPCLEVFQELHELDAFPESLLNDDGVVLDIGANIGLFTLLCHRRHPRAAYVCVEPDPIMFRLLQQNLNANGVDNAIIHNVAAGRRKEDRVFHRCRPLPTLSGRGLLEISRPWFNPKWIEDIDVAYSDLDSLLEEKCLRKINFLKIDVEGDECDVLLGAENVLSATDVVQIETHSKKNEISVSEILKRNGFRLSSAVENGYTGQYVEMRFCRRRLDNEGFNNGCA